MKIKTAEFIKSATKNSGYPNYIFPEFAFIGKSNVGKSSLINMITGRKSLVKTGSRPGVTQLINFFLINNNTSIVDLPGYGFAKVPERIRKNFYPMIKEYFSSRENLKAVFVLVDSRRDVTDKEKEIITLLSDNNIPTCIVMTKSDKLSKNQLNKQRFKTAKSLGIEIDWIICSSVLKNTGKKEILEIIDSFK